MWAHLLCQDVVLPTPSDGWWWLPGNNLKGHSSAHNRVLRMWSAWGDWKPQGYRGKDQDQMMYYTTRNQSAEVKILIKRQHVKRPVGQSLQKPAGLIGCSSSRVKGQTCDMWEHEFHCSTQWSSSNPMPLVSVWRLHRLKKTQISKCRSDWCVCLLACVIDCLHNVTTAWHTTQHNFVFRVLTPALQIW